MPIDDILKQAATASALTKATNATPEYGGAMGAGLAVGRRLRELGLTMFAPQFVDAASASTKATKATPEYGGAMGAGLAVNRRLRGLGLTMFAPQFVDAARNSSLAQARQMTGGSSVNPTASAILNMKLGKLPNQGQASALDDANKPDQGVGFDTLPFDIHQFKIAVKSQRKGQTRPLVPTVDQDGHYTLGMAAMRVATTLGDRSLYRKLLNPASPEFKRLDKATGSVPARYQPSLDAQVEQSGETGLGAQLIKEYGVQGLANQSELGLRADSIGRVMSPVTTLTGLMGDSRVAHRSDGGQDDFEWWEQPARFTEDVALQVLTGGAVRAVGAGMARAAVRGAARATGPSLIRSAMRPVLTDAIRREAAQVAVKAGTTSLMRQVVSRVAVAARAQVSQITPQIVSGAEMRKGQGEAPVEAYGRAAGDALIGYVSSNNPAAANMTPGERITAVGQLALTALGVYEGAMSYTEFWNRFTLRKISPGLADRKLDPNVAKPLYQWARQVHKDARKDPAAVERAQRQMAHLLGDLPRDDFRVAQGAARGVTVTPHDSLGVDGGGIIEGQINSDGSIEVRRDTPDAHLTHELDHQSEAALGLDPQSFVTRFSEGDRDQIAGHIYELALQDAQRRNLPPKMAKEYAEYYSGRRKRLSGGGYDFIENGTGDSELARFAIQRAFDGEKPGRRAPAAYKKLIAGMDPATLNRLRPERIGHGEAARSGLARPVTPGEAASDYFRRQGDRHFARNMAVDTGEDGIHPNPPNVRSLPAPARSMSFTDENGNPLPDAPRRNQRIRDVVTERLRGGRPLPDKVPPVRPDQEAFQMKVADDYEKMPIRDRDPVVKQAYQALVKELDKQYRALPIKIEFMPKKDGEFVDSYGSDSQSVFNDMHHNGRLYIYPTAPETFGPKGVDVSDHPLLGKSPFKTDSGEPMLWNDVLRAVHDAIAHGGYGASFGPKGEETAFKAHALVTDDPMAIWALATETRGQNSWVNFGPQVRGRDGALLPPHETSPLANRDFAIQKTGLLPLEDVKIGDPEVDAKVDHLKANQPEWRHSVSFDDSSAKRPRINRTNLNPDPTDQVSHLAGVVKNALVNLNRTLNTAPTTGVAKNRRMRFKDKNGIVHIGAGNEHGKAFNDWTDEVETTLTEDELRSARQWYSDVYNNFRPLFGDDSDRITAAWLASQQNKSVPEGFQDVMRVLDEIQGIGSGKKGGLAHDKIKSILQGTMAESGFGQKLLDFTDSALGKKTRTYTGSDPAGGGPFTADIHSARDSGHVDHTMLQFLIDRFGNGEGSIDGKEIRSVEVTKTKTVKIKDKTQTIPVKAEFTLSDGSVREVSADLLSSPSDGQYTGINRWGNKLTEYLNATGFDGGGWTAYEAQAVGWVRNLKTMGRTMDTVQDAIKIGTRRMSLEANYSSGGTLKHIYPEFSSLSDSVAKSVTESALVPLMKRVIDDIGGSLRYLSHKSGIGFWGGEASPSTQFWVMGSSDAADLLANSMALATDQAGTMHMTFGRGGKSSLAGIISKADGTALSDSEVLDLLDFAKEHHPGAIQGLSAHPMPGMDGHVIAGLTESKYSKVEQAVNSWATSRDIDTATTATSAVTKFGGHDFEEDPTGGKYRQGIQDAGGARISGQIPNYRRWAAEALEDAFREHAPGLLDESGRSDRIQRAVEGLDGSLAPGGGSLLYEGQPRHSMSFGDEPPLRRDERPRTSDRPEDPTIGERERNRDILLRRARVGAGDAPGVTRRTWEEAQGLADMRAAKEDVSRVLGEKPSGAGISDVEQAQAYAELHDLEALIDHHDAQMKEETRPEYQEAIRRDRDQAVQQYADLSAKVMDLKGDNGRNLAAARMLASSFSGNVERALKRAAALARRDLTEPEKKAITDAAHKVTRIQEEIDGISEGKTGGEETVSPEVEKRHRAAMMLLAEKIAAPTETTGWEFAKAIWKASLLTSLRASEASLIGNAVMQVSNTASRIPASILDSILAIKTGDRTVSMRGSLHGFRATYSLDSARAAYNALIHGSSELGALKSDVNRKIMYKKGGWLTIAMSHAANKVFDVLETADTPVRRGELTRALQEAAWLHAKNEGLKGPAIEARMNELLGSDPKPEIVLAAMASRIRTGTPKQVAIIDAIRQAAFQREDEAVMANSSQATRLASGASRLAPILMPFAKIPTNAVAQGLEHTPVGGIYGAVRAVQALTGGGKDAQRQAVTALGKSMTGAGLMTLGYLAYKSGVVSMPTGITKAERDTQEATGVQGNSIKVGNRWYSMKDYPPAILIMAGAMLASKEAEGEKITPWNIAVSTGAATAGAVRDLPTLQGVTAITDAQRDVQKAYEDGSEGEGDVKDAAINNRFLGQLAGSVIPAGVADALTAGDDKARIAKSPADNFKADTPGRTELPMQYDALGRPVTRNTGMMSQVRGLSVDQSQRQQDPVVKEITRLGVQVSKATMVSNPKRVDRDLTTADYSERLRRVGEATRQAIVGTMGSDWYRGASDAERKAELERAIKLYRTAANKAIKLEREAARQ